MCLSSSNWYGTAPPICGGHDRCLSLAAAVGDVVAGGGDAEFGSMEFRLLFLRRSKPPPPPPPPLCRLLAGRPPPSRLSPVDFRRDDLLPMAPDLKGNGRDRSVFRSASVVL